MLTVEEVSRSLRQVASAYSQQFIGRDRDIELIVLALISKQHIYMISPPGTGKTMLEYVVRGFGMSFMYYLFNYDTKLEDIVYNPVVRKETVEGGEKIVVEYELKNPGLGTVEIFFADEMFKAPTAVLNALLGAMNERRVTLGSKEYKIPLWTLVAASNELPERAEALLDRFLFRDFLEYLPKERWYEYLLQYWNIHQPGFRRVIVTVPKQVLELAHQYMWQVDIPLILDDYVKLLDKLHEHNIVLSDRRKGRILQAVAAHAVLHGRLEPEPEDLQVLIYTVPTRLEELETVVKIVDEYLGGLVKIRDELRRIEGELREYLVKIRTMSIDDIAQLLGDTLPEIKRKLSDISSGTLHYVVERITELAAEVEEQAVDVLASKLLS